MFTLSFRRSVVFSLAAAFLLSVAFVPAAISRTEHQPIIVDAQDSLVPGEALPVEVDLTGGPANVTVYSSPVGAVSFSGPVASASSVVSANTNPNLAPGTPVTIYAVTDGATVVSTHVTAEQDANAGPIPHP